MVERARSNARAQRDLGAQGHLINAPAADWFQANVRLRRRNGDGMPSALALFGELQTALRGWRSSGDVRGFFFMRKPPGLRLRFALGRPRARVRLIAALDALRAAGIITRWTPARYEPETQLLGGTQLLPLVHAHFDADSRACMRYLRTEQPSLTAPVLSLALLNDLFSRVLQADEEVWDVWCNLATLHQSQPASGPATTPAIQLADLSPRVAPAERRLLATYARANQALARGMNRLADRGALPHGRRSILPFIALFHWNRYGITLEQRSTLYGAMTRAFDPGGAMRGRLPDCTVDG